MTRPLRSLASVACLVVLSLIATDAFAKCTGRPTFQREALESHVFWAAITDVRTEGDWTEADVRTLQAYRGYTPAKLTVRMRSTDTLKLSPSPHLLFTTSGENGQYIVNGCGNSGLQLTRFSPDEINRSPNWSDVSKLQALANDIRRVTRTAIMECMPPKARNIEVFVRRANGKVTVSASHSEMRSLPLTKTCAQDRIPVSRVADFLAEHVGG